MYQSIISTLDPGCRLGGGVVLGALLAGGQVPALHQLPHLAAAAGGGVPQGGAEPGHVGAGAVKNGFGKTLNFAKVCFQL